MPRIPSLSLVVPTRNRLGRVRALLELLASEPGWHEAVIVDDGSDDGTADLLNTKADERIVPVIQEHRGPAAARNAGWERAGGEIILLIDDDVIPVEGTIGRHAEFHASRPDPNEIRIGRLGYPPDLEVNFFMRYLIESPYGAFNPHRRIAPGQRYRLMTTSAVSLKRELLERARGFDESFPYAWGEDFELGHRLMKLGARFSADDSVTFHHHKSYNLREFCCTLRLRAPESVRMELTVKPNWQPKWLGCSFRSETFEAILELAEQVERAMQNLDDESFGCVGLRDGLWELYRAALAFAHNNGMVEAFLQSGAEP